MKKIKLFIFTFLLACSIQTVSALDTGINPAYLELKVYKMAVSSSVYCTDLVTVFENDNPVYEDFLASPQLGSGSVMNGTYPCIVIEFSDIIKWASEENSDSANCVVGQLETQEICRAGGGDSDFTLIDGTQGTCVDGEQRIAMYLSTASTLINGENGNAFVRPTAADTNKGLPLLNSLIVSGGTAAKFIVDGLGKIEDSSGQCEMMPPAFSFSKI